MADYTEEELQGLKRVSLEMAQVVFDFCKKHDLTVYLCGGGCIGALRHGGYIPWDDDLDYFMPRKDYERFIILWKQEGDVKYRLSVSDRDYNDRNLFATLRDTSTTQVKPYQKDLDIPHGVALDILPLDGYPEGGMKRKMQCIHALIYSLFCAQTVPEKHGGLMGLGSRVLLGIFRGKKIRYRIYSRAKRKMTKYDIDQCQYITELCSGPFYMKKKYKKEWFDTYVVKPFEDTELPIPVGYDGYLREAFGDYMELPPVEARVAHHDTYYLNLKEGYEKYRGTKYLEP